MSDPNIETKVDGGTQLTAEEVNAIVASIETKFDSDDVGMAAGNLVVLGADGKIPSDLLPDDIGTGGGGGTGNLVGPGGATSAGRVAVFADTGGVNIAQGEPYALLPAPGTSGNVPISNGTAWVSGPNVADATVDSQAIAGAIDAETNEVTDFSGDVFVPVSDGAATPGKANIGGNAATFDPNSLIGTDAGGSLQSLDYEGVADAIGLGDGSDVTFGSVSVGDPDTTLTRVSPGVIAVEGETVVTGESPVLTSPQVTTIELGHASDTTLTRVSPGVAAIEGATILTGADPQITTIELGHASDTTLSRAAAGVIAVEGAPLYPNIPQNSKSAAYTTVLGDAQKHLLHPSADTTARIWTIDSNANVAYPIGTALTFVNQNSAGTLTIKITSDTMRLAGAGTTGDRTLAANGIATAIKIASTEWIISGVGLT